MYNEVQRAACYQYGLLMNDIVQFIQFLPLLLFAPRCEYTVVMATQTFIDTDHPSSTFVYLLFTKDKNCKDMLGLGIGTSMNSFQGIHNASPLKVSHERCWAICEVACFTPALTESIFFRWSVLSCIAGEYCWTTCTKNVPKERTMLSCIMPYIHSLLSTCFRYVGVVCNCNLLSVLVYYILSPLLIFRITWFNSFQ